jgi:hypothetical protein
VISLNDTQLQTVTRAAALLPIEKRSQFLERVAAMLKLRGRFTDADVNEIARLALAGLAHEPQDESAA